MKNLNENFNKKVNLKKLRTVMIIGMVLAISMIAIACPTTTLTTTPINPNSYGWFNPIVKVSINLSPGSVPGIIKYTYDLNKKRTPYPDLNWLGDTNYLHGIKTIRYAAVGKDGSKEPEKTYTVQVDSIAPETLGFSLDTTNGVIYNPGARAFDINYGIVKVRIISGDNTSGLSTCQLNFDYNALNPTAGWDAPTPNVDLTYGHLHYYDTNGIKVIVIKCTDKGLNTSTPALSPFTFRVINPYDRTPPISTLIIDTNSTSTEECYNDKVLVSIIAEDPQSGVAAIKYCIDTNDTCVPNINYTTQLLFTDGKKYLRYRAINLHGVEENINSEMINIDKNGCGRECEPHTIGYWKQPCKGHYEHETQASMLGYLAEIQATSDYFDFISSFNGMCDILDPDEPATMKQRAKQQFLALWLNVVTDKLFTYTTISLPAYTDANTVGGAITVIQNNISSNSEKAKTIADKLNNGIGIVDCQPSKPLKIIAQKIVCENEADLPNWGLGGPNITALTAMSFVATHPGCKFDSNWYFQWAKSGTSNPGSNTGEAAPNTGWKTFGPTNAQGEVNILISDFNKTNKIWVREVFKQGYVSFTYDTNGNSNNVSAEIYCYKDVFNYDNYDSIGAPQLGRTYYCVAWNAIKKYECTSDANCSDGVYCNGAEKCNLQNHKCEKGILIDCNSLNDQCNSGVCDENVDKCIANPVPNGTTCNDNLFCNTGEVCNNGKCGNGGVRDCSDYNILGISTCLWDPDGLDYTWDFRSSFTSICNEELDKCAVGDYNITHIVDEKCAECLGDSDCPQPENACMENRCQNYKCALTPKPSTTSCNNGAYCDGADRCDGNGMCLATGSSVDCSGLDDQCNSGVCDENVDKCIANPVPNGTTCNDNLFCNVGEVCDNGKCESGQARDCSDNNILGISSCFWNPDGLDYTWDFRNPFTSICDEGNDKCTTGDLNINHTIDPKCTKCMTDSDCPALENSCMENRCIEYKCVETPKPSQTTCDNGLYCDGADRCDGNGMCFATGSSVDCSGLDDQCNSGVCDENQNSCVKTPARNGAACDDNLFCNTGEVCSNGICGNGNTKDCSENNILGVSSCLWIPDGLDYTWDFRNPFTSICDEGNDKCTTGDLNINHTIDEKCAECMIDADCPTLENSCAENKCLNYKCVETPRPTTTVCDNGTYCDGADRCDGNGACKSTGTPVDCSSLNNQCNSGVCDENIEGCVAQPVPNGTTCNDDLFCNTGEICLNGTCGGGQARDCSGFNLNPIGQCDYFPDGYAWTYDYFLGFLSQCSEEQDKCTDGNITITSYCSTENCDAECETDLDCSAHFDGNVCNYRGLCGAEPSCACSYQKELCPAPGTIVDGYCYWGNGACTSTGCDLNKTRMDCYKRCDPILGPVELPIIKTTKFVGQPKSHCNYLGDLNEAEECLFVTTATEFMLDSNDSNASTYYRQRWKEDYNSTWGNWSEWNEYTQPFNYLEDSIHELEYYSINEICEIEEKHNYEIDIVDTKAPSAKKTVENPKVKWTPSKNGQPGSIFYPWINNACWNDVNGIDCWKVTLDTPISFDCNDLQPHPSNNSKVCFNVEWDANDITPKYCTQMQGTIGQDGYCCVPDDARKFNFLEETEHNLKFYCKDVLGNKSPIDDEKFKVGGTEFEIQLNKKWNLISIPFALLDSNVAEVIDEIDQNIESVWTYDAFTDQWYVYRPLSPSTSNLETIEPGNGYWVAALNPAKLVLGGSLFNPIATPPQKSLKAGWNLIGYYGTEGQMGYYGPIGSGKTAGCELYSLGNTILDKGWTSLFTFWALRTPSQWLDLSYYNRMDPGAGYWISVPSDDVLSYSSTCS